jgi:hypothetical protein
VATLIEQTRRRVKDSAREPLFTLKELLVFAVFCVVYGAILFSLDPEWVAWAAPLAFGGALYAQAPLPASAGFGPPGHVLLVACIYSLVAFLLIELVSVVRGKQRRRAKV